jgi:hypothetical protein
MAQLTLDQLERIVLGELISAPSSEIEAGLRGWRIPRVWVA